MRNHSQSAPKPNQRERKTPARKPHPASRNAPAKPPRTETGFLAAWQRLLGTYQPTVPKRRGRKPRVPLLPLLAALVFHVMNGVGTLAGNFAALFDDALNDSSCASRRARLPWQVFTDLMQRLLRPLAQKRRHPEAFWRHLRLLGLDGTQFSVTNTPQVKDQCPKAQSRRGRAAFAKIVTGVLLEIGLHNPLAAAIGHRGQSEWELARSLLARLPKQALLLADRLHGCAAFVAEVWAACQRVQSHYLIRARTNIKVRTVRRFKDGSRLVRVPVRPKGQPRVIAQWLELRELRVTVQRPGHRSTFLRLWTSLLDSRTAPALELAALYAQRWEHELFYRQLKRQLRKSEVLQSHTPETGAQEIAALMLAAALLAAERAQAAAGQVPVLRISFLKLLALMRPLWLVLALGDDLLEEWQKQELTERFHNQARRCLTPRRRARSCPRAVRQPVGKWPRLRRNESWSGAPTYKII
jgi:hypothetical protein